MNDKTNIAIVISGLWFNGNGIQFLDSLLLYNVRLITAFIACFQPCLCLAYNRHMDSIQIDQILGQEYQRSKKVNLYVNT